MVEGLTKKNKNSKGMKDILRALYGDEDQQYGLYLLELLTEVNRVDEDQNYTWKKYDRLLEKNIK